VSKRPYQKGDQGGYKYLKKYWDKHGWKPREIAYLKRHFKDMSDLELSRTPLLKKRSRRSVMTMRWKLGLRKDPKNLKIWTDEEEGLLKKHWLQYNQNELHDKFLPNKTPQQIRQKKMHMGLKGKKYVWNHREIETLIKVGAENTANTISAKYIPTKTPSQIRGARKYYGIKYIGTKNAK
jgi:hypothetical protein